MSKLPEVNRRIIKNWKQQIIELEMKIDDFVDKVLEETGQEQMVTGIDFVSGNKEVLEGCVDTAQWFHIGNSWDCPDSPFGLCMYHTINDPAKDDCVFCHHPLERK